jgi:hypothetical protein
MPKFDVVVGNPPYKGGLHLKFLELAYSISNEMIIWISPSAWILDEKKIDKKAKIIRDLVGNNIENIEFFNGNEIFNVGLFLPFSIITIDKNKKSTGIDVSNKIYNNSFRYDSIEEINKWNNLEVYPDLKYKVLKLSNNDNLLTHKNEENGPYYISLPLIRGHIIRKPGNEMVMDDFYSFFPGDIEIKKSFKRRKWGESRDFYFSFKTEKEAKNFMDFLKTRWGMFSLSINKMNGNLNRGELASVPWLDWSRSWTEKDFEELIDATPEEKEFVYKNIPDYYGISKAKDE